MAISRSQMQRQLQNRGGITNLSPRQNFGLGSSLKKFVRKIIPNEVSKVATAAAPFVAPFNPALAAGMAGIGSFDQTGSMSDAFKRGALTYGGGQAARYIGGAGFQGNPFQGNALSNFTSFSSPLGTQTGLGKMFEQRRVANIGKDLKEIGEVQGLTGSDVGGNITMAESAGSPIIEASEGAISVTGNTTEKIKENVFQRIMNDPSVSNIGNEALNAAKKAGKAIFFDKDGNLDKNVLLGTIAFTASYAEAKSLANDVGVDLTESEYDEARKAEKQEQYAADLQNFFGGKKDGGRIGFAEGSEDITILEKIKDFAGGAVEKLGEEAMYKFNEFVYNEPALYGYMANNYDANTLQNPKAREEIRTFYDKLNPKKQEYIEMYLDSIAYPDDDSYKDWLFSKPSKISFPTDERMEDHNKQYDFLPYGKDAYSIRAKTDKDLSKFMKADGGRIGFDNGGFSIMDGITAAYGKGMNKSISKMKRDEDLTRDEIARIKMAVFEVLDQTAEGDQSTLSGGFIDNLGDALEQIARPDLSGYIKDYAQGTGIFAKDFIVGGKEDILKKADGGRIGLREGSGSKKKYGLGIESAVKQIDPLQGGLDELKMGGGIPMAFTRLEKSFLFKNLAKLGGADRSFTMPQLYRILSNPSKFPKDAQALKAFLKIKGYQKGGDVGTAPEVPVRTNAAGVKELDYRQSGGFVPVGVKEKADDVPAMLSKNEFVLTADAVRGIGGGSVENGSKKLYNVMKQAEQVGKA